MSPGARPPAFACALSIRGSDARGRLLSLDRTIEDPMREDTPAAARLLSQPACLLIAFLSDEIDARCRANSPAFPRGPARKPKLVPARQAVLFAAGCTPNISGAMKI